MPNQDTDLDALLNEEDSSSDQSHDPQQNPDDKSKTSEEMLEFNKLTGSTQDRVRALIRRAKTAESEAEKARTLAYKNTQLPPPPANPDIQQAKKQLENAGIMTDEKFEQMMQQREARQAYETKVRQLEQLESGDDGRPKFDRYEYEDFVRSHPQYQYYDPQDVFGIMYRQELLNWEMTHRETDAPKSAPLKNSKTFTGSDVWTPEYIDQQVREHGLPWYEKNFDKIQKVLEASSQS